MQYRFFVIPTRHSQAAEEELNGFLRSRRILSVHREFIANGENSYWSLAVEYLEGDRRVKAGSGERAGPKVDYREVLSQEDFRLYARLREWRKEISRQEAVPVFAVFTNEQLAAIAEKRPPTLAALQEVNGIGQGRAGKYGAAVLKLVNGEIADEKGGQPLSPDR